MEETAARCDTPAETLTPDNKIKWSGIIANVPHIFLL